MLISQRFSFVCGIRFTLPFRKTITIDAGSIVSRTRRGVLAAIPKHRPVRCSAEPGSMVAMYEIRTGDQLRTASRCAASGARAKSSIARRGASLPRPPLPRMIGTIVLRIWESEAPGTVCAGLGNEGVGEHVRTKFHLGKDRR